MIHVTGKVCHRFCVLNIKGLSSLVKRLREKMLRMTQQAQKSGKIRYGALIFSIVAHSTVLGVFTGVQMTTQKTQADASRPILTLEVIERVVADSTPKPIPVVKPTPKKEHPPLVAESEPDEPKVAEVLPELIEAQIIEPAVEPEPVVDEVEFFGQKSVVQRICYVVDCSGSMYGQMYQVKDQLRESILKLNSQQAFSVVFFMDGQTILTTGNGRLLPATARVKSQALERIDAIRPGGSTDADHALDVAMRLRDPNGKGPQVVYFLTDGFNLDQHSSQLFVEKVDRLRKTLAPNATMHTIGFWPQPRDRQMLQQIANSGQGEFIEIN